jgi:hypothetical protein
MLLSVCVILWFARRREKLATGFWFSRDARSSSVAENLVRQVGRRHRQQRRNRAQRVGTACQAVGLEHAQVSVGKQNSHAQPPTCPFASTAVFWLTKFVLLEMSVSVESPTKTPMQITTTTMKIRVLQTHVPMFQLLSDICL